jgi:hypothetical protein
MAAVVQGFPGASVRTITGIRLSLQDGKHVGGIAPADAYNVAFE